jgi:Fur family transcriptional regulator, peroxide stress response regulator
MLPGEMNTAGTERAKTQLSQRLATGGFRFTPQRERVYAVLLNQRDHPTAEEVFIRAKRVMPDISMATVYNCLDALVQCGLVRQVTLARGAARFCPNMREHSHFYCDTCESVFDLAPPLAAGLALPKGFMAERLDLAIHGRCPACANGKRNGRPAHGRRAHGIERV